MLAAPAGGMPQHFSSACNNYPLQGWPQGPCSRSRAKPRKRVTMLERAAWPFSISQGGAPAPALSFFSSPPTLPTSSLKGKSWRWKQRAASPSSGGEQSKESTVWSPLSQPRVWVILPHSDKPDTPIPGPLSPTEGLLLGQSPSLPAAAGSKATAKNSTFA